MLNHPVLLLVLSLLTVFSVSWADDHSAFQFGGDEYAYLNDLSHGCRDESVRVHGTR